MTNKSNESTIEDATLEWFGGLGYEALHGPEIALGESGQERGAFRDVLLAGRFHDGVDVLHMNAHEGDS